MRTKPWTGAASLAARSGVGADIGRRRSPESGVFGVEALEQRRMLAVITWDGGGDGRSWMDARNWSADVLPGGQDDAVIDGRGPAITFDAGTNLVDIHALRSTRAVDFTKGALRAERDVELLGGFGLAGTAAVESSRGRVRALGVGSTMLVAGTVRAHDIVLAAGADGVLQITGRLDAASTGGVGGRIEATGLRVVLQGATVDASGRDGGGEVLLGGDYQGGGSTPRAWISYVDAQTRILADSTGRGAGGRVIVWSDYVTGFYGKISVRGAGGGAGGFVETSGKEGLDSSGEVDAGAGGAWLLDPRSVTISTGLTAGGAFGGGNPTTFTPTADNANVRGIDITNAMSAGTNVVVTTGGTGTQAGSISVNTALAVSGGAPGTLTLRAAGDIVFNASVTSTTAGATLILSANDQTPGADPNPAAGNVLFSAGMSMSLGVGTLTVSGVSFSTQTTGTITAGGITANMTGDIQVNGDMSAGAGAITLNAGTDGTGALSFGAAGVDLAGATIVLRAGDGTGGGGAGATVDANTNSPTFRGSGGVASATRPTAFTLRQDAVILDTTIPAAARFGAALASMAYTLRSDDATATVASAAKVAGSSLTVQAASGVAFGASANFSGLSLNGNVDGDATGNVLVAGTVSTSTFASAGVNFTNSGAISATSLVQLVHAGAVSVNNDIDGIEGLVFIQGSSITLAGAVSSNPGILLQATGGDITQTAGSVIAATLRLTASGVVTLTQPANDFDTIAGTVSGSITYVDADSVLVDVVSGTNGLTSSNGDISITILLAGASISINQPLSAPTGDITLDTPSGGQSGLAGAVVSQGLRLLSGSNGASWSLNGTVATLAMDATASLVYTDTDGLVIGVVGGTAGITDTGPDVTLNVNGALSIQAPISINDGRLILSNSGTTSQTATGAMTMGGLALQGSGIFLLTGSSNNTVNFAASGPALISYADAGDVAISTVVLASGVNAANFTLSAAGNVQIARAIQASTSATIAAGSDGSGVLSFTGAALSIISPSITLRAGDGAGGVNTASVDAITNAPSFRAAAGGGAPSFFTLRQDSAIADAAIPSQTQFNGVLGMNYSLISDAGSTTVLTLAKVGGANLTLAGLPVVIQGAIAPLSLTVTSAASIATASLPVTNGVTFAGPVTLLTSTTITGASVAFNSTVNGDVAGLRSLTVNSAGLTSFGGVVGGAAALSTLITNAPGSLAFSGGVITTGDQDYREAGINLTGSTLLNAGAGSILFAAGSSLGAGANNLTLRASEIALGGSVSGSGVLTLEPGAATGNVIIGGAGVTADLDLTTAKLAAIQNGFSSIVIGRSDGSGQITVAGASVFNDSLTLRAPAAGGAIRVNAPLTGGVGAAITFIGSGSTTTLNADVRTSGQTITFNDAVVLGASVVVDTTGAGGAPGGANVLFLFALNGTSAGGQTLTLTTGASGFTSFASGVGSTVPLRSLTAGSVRFEGGTSVTTSTAGGGAGSITLGGVVLGGASGSVITLSAGGPVAVGGTVNALTAGQQGLSVNAPSAAFASPIGATSALRSFSVSGTARIDASVDASSSGGGSGDITLSGLLTLGGLAGNVVAFRSTGGTTRFNAGVEPLAAGQQGLSVVGSMVLGGSGAGAIAALRSLAVTSGSAALIGGGAVRTTSGAGGSGAQTWNAPVTLQGGVSFNSTGGAVTFLLPLNAGAQSVSFRSRDLSFGAAVSGTGAIVIEPDLAGGNILLGAADGAGGALDLDAVSLSRLANGFSSITIGRADGSGVLTVGGASTFSDPVVLQSPTAPGRIAVNAPLLGVDNATFTFIGSGATTVLNADVRTSGQAITFNDSVLIATSLVTIDTTNGGAVPTGASITFGTGFTVNSETSELNSLTVRSGTTGATTFGGAVGGALGGRLGTLTTDSGGVTRLGPLVAAVTQAYADAAEIRGVTLLAGASITFSSTLNSSGEIGDLQVQSLGGPATLAFLGAVGGVAPFGTLTTDSLVATTVSTPTVRTNGDQTFGGQVALGTSATFTGGSVRFLGALVGGGNALTVVSAGVTEFAGAVAGLTTVATNAGGSTLINTPNFSVTTAAVFGDGVVVGIGTTIKVSAGPLTFGSTLNIQTFNTILIGTEIDFNGTVSGTARLVMRPADPTQNVNVAHATEASGPGLDITETELNLFQSDLAELEFGRDDGTGTLDVQNYVFSSGVVFVMASGSGQIQVSGDVEVDDDSGSIGVRGTGSTTHLRGSLITRGGGIDIDDSVLIELPSVTLDTTGRGQRPGGAVRVQHRIDSAPGLANSLLVQAGIGTATFGESIGSRSSGQLGLFTVVSGGINLNAPSVRTNDAQTYTGPVTLGPSVTLQTLGRPITFNGAVNGQANLTIAPGSGATTFNGGAGGVTVLASLTINAGSTRIFNGPVSVQVLTIFGGSVEFNGLSRVTTGLLISGSLGGAGDVIFDQPLTWVGGNMIGSGRTIISGTGALVISGGPKTLSRQIDNAGTVYWTDGDVQFSGGSFINRAGGQFFAQSEGSFAGVGGVNSFVNQGTLERSGTGLATFSGMTFSNPGAITILSGDLQIAPAQGPFVSSGIMSIGSASSLIVTGDFLLPAVGRLNVAIAGIGQFGKVVVSGTASLAGDLGVTFANGFSPPGGSRFEVVTAASVVGQFGRTFLPTLPGRSVVVQYGSTFAAVVVLSGTDFNGDGVTDPDDLADFISGFFAHPADPRTDFNGDGVVDPDDLADFIAAFFGR